MYSFIGNGMNDKQRLFNDTIICHTTHYTDSGQYFKSTLMAIAYDTLK